MYRREQQQSEREALERARATLAEHAGVLSQVTDAAGRFFRHFTEGKVFKRSPGLKLALPDPGNPQEKDDFRKLLIYPQTAKEHVPNAFGRLGDRQVVVHPEWVALDMHWTHVNRLGQRETRSRLRAYLYRKPQHWLGLYHPDTVDVDAARLCAIATRFLADPAGVFAQSVDHCSFCGRFLETPESRRRGIGPECFGRYGDFVGYLHQDGPAVAIAEAVG
jgi:hypothetical protein